MKIVFSTWKVMGGKFDHSDFTCWSLGRDFRSFGVEMCSFVKRTVGARLEALQKSLTTRRRFVDSLFLPDFFLRPKFAAILLGEKNPLEKVNGDLLTKSMFDSTMKKRNHFYLKLTACPWKTVVGRRSFPFGRPIFKWKLVASLGNKFHSFYSTKKYNNKKMETKKTGFAYHFSTVNPFLCLQKKKLT